VIAIKGGKGETVKVFIKYKQEGGKKKCNEEVKKKE
jgi:hypothetical protein